MRTLRFLSVITLGSALGCAASESDVESHEQPLTGGSLYRATAFCSGWCSPYGDNLLTVNASEYNSLGSPWQKHGRIGSIWETQYPSMLPLYRMNNSSWTDHLFPITEAEYESARGLGFGPEGDCITNSGGCRYGIGWVYPANLSNDDGNCYNNLRRVFRLWCPNQSTHWYTTSKMDVKDKQTSNQCTREPNGEFTISC